MGSLGGCSRERVECSTTSSTGSGKPGLRVKGECEYSTASSTGSRKHGWLLEGKSEHSTASSTGCFAEANFPHIARRGVCYSCPDSDASGIRKGVTARASLFFIPFSSTSTSDAASIQESQENA